MTTRAAGGHRAWEADPLFEPEVLEELRGLTDQHGHDLAAAVVDLFERSTPAVLGDLQHAFRIGRAREVEALAHRLKGSAATIGCVRLARLCEELESAAAEGRLEEGTESMGALLDTYGATLTQMRVSVPLR